MADTFASSFETTRLDRASQVLLRAPPFPGAKPAGAPIRVSSHEAGQWSGDALDVVARAITSARVGGAFWSPLPTEEMFETVLRASSAPEARHRLGQWRDRLDGQILLSVPGPRSRHLKKIDEKTALLVGPVDPWSLLDQAQHIVAAPQDEVALLAVAAGRTVTDLATAQPIDPAEMREHLAGTLKNFTYFDPFSGRRIDILEWIEVLGTWRAAIDINRSIGAVAGITAWKRRTLKHFLWSNRPTQALRNSVPRSLPYGSAIALWPSRVSKHMLKRVTDRGLPVIRVEDGFVRSIGLGAHLHQPSSIVFDTRGIYYDPARPSDLEHILAETIFTDRLIERSIALIERLVRGGVTKYAAGDTASSAIPARGRRVLVPGQVEDDLSVRLGGAGVCSNLDLLRRVRRAEPDAWIAYRPHPDVTAGLRKGHVSTAEALSYADAILIEGSMAGLLERVDCVHVLTSLAGFEALLRGREVVTHGQPFYAGWGLTTDLAPHIPRRHRCLTVPELAAGALILYPRYLDPVTRLPCPPEVLVDRHADAPKARPHLLNRLRSLQGRALVAGRRLSGALA
ncbi:MAG: beta-3-deoxy-D-manno-oct-2-ulosonic acid transferase [Pseudomonadota bacterium]|jgi:capsular polysaccharide export protein